MKKLIYIQVSSRNQMSINPNKGNQTAGEQYERYNVMKS